MLRRFLNVSLIAALIVALSAALPLPTSRAQDDLIADLGFRPETDGFAFQNYGNENNPTNLTSAELIRIFGAERVCAGAVREDGTCKLTAPAAAS